MIIMASLLSFSLAVHLEAASAITAEELTADIDIPSVKDKVVEELVDSSISFGDNPDASDAVDKAQDAIDKSKDLVDDTLSKDDDQQPTNKLLYGSEDNDELVGGESSNEISGGPGDDKLVGGPDSDFMTGGPGDDVLEGGPGADFFHCGSGVDRVVDFNPGEGDFARPDCENIN